MSELQNTLFGGKSEEAAVSAAKEEINGQVTLDDAYTPIVPDQEDTTVPAPSPDDLIRESMNAVERMKQEIAEENKNLDMRFAANKAKNAEQTVTRRRSVYVVGVLSAAASLIFMGVAMIISLSSSPIGVYAAIKLSPVMLIFIGAEILFAVFRRHSLRIRIDIRSVIIVVILMVISLILSVVSVVASAGTGERVYAEKRIQNMLANELRDTIAKDYIRSVDIDTELFGDNAEMYNTPADLTNGDIINLTVNFSDAQMTIRDFAKECKSIIDDLHKLSYNFGTVKFVADDLINHYALVLDWHYQSDFGVDKLAGFVNYSGNGISDADIPDVSDDED